jgi:hypothetical protein
MRLRIYFLAAMLLPSCTGKQMISKTMMTDSVVYWSETRKLTWDDFQGQPVVMSGNAGSPACEIVVKNPSSIERKNLFAKTKVVAECYFDKKNSWVNKAHTSDDLLLYNQTIFDIYELYTRKLRQTFETANFDFNSATKVFNETVNHNNDALFNRLREFRTETKMGTAVEKIELWAGKINFELKGLEGYRTDQ